MPPWLQFIIDLIFGGKKQSATDQQLGRAEQQHDDAASSAKEDERAQQIDENVDRMSHDQLVDELRGPRAPDPGGKPNGAAGAGGL